MSGLTIHFASFWEKLFLKLVIGLVVLASTSFLAVATYNFNRIWTLHTNQRDLTASVTALTTSINSIKTTTDTYVYRPEWVIERRQITSELNSLQKQIDRTEKDVANLNTHVLNMDNKIDQLLLISKEKNNPPKDYVGQR